VRKTFAPRASAFFLKAGGQFLQVRRGIAFDFRDAAANPQSMPS
jgi:hypothetical protein